MTALDLYSNRLGGSGRPILILHGLFGSGKNWTQVGRALAEYGAVYALDARNHGDSPPGPTHTLADMTADLSRWIENHLDEAPILLGHSMGGMTVMHYLLGSTPRAQAAIVVDIAPRSYRPRHAAEFAALSLDVSRHPDRKAVDAAMAAYLPDLALRRFLQMNLASRNEGGYRWKLNVPVLRDSTYIQDIDFEERRWSGPALFLIGGASDFVSETDEERIRKHFPDATLAREPDGDHWLHYSSQEWFLLQAISFLRLHSS